MAYVETFKCDHCGVIKKEINNWFIIHKALVNFTVYKWAENIARGERNNPDYMHACGIECANRIQARLMEKMQGVTKESTPAIDYENKFRNATSSTDEVVSLLTKTN